MCVYVFFLVKESLAFRGYQSDKLWWFWLPHFVIYSYIYIYNFGLTIYEYTIKQFLMVMAVRLVGCQTWQSKSISNVSVRARLTSLHHHTYRYHWWRFFFFWLYMRDMNEQFHCSKVAERHLYFHRIRQDYYYYYHISLSTQLLVFTHSLGVIIYRTLASLGRFSIIEWSM